MIYSSLYPIPERCDVCKSMKVEFVHISEIGKKSVSKWPFVYYCRNCEASVGCHKGTKRPLGRMADRHVRRLRKIAHKYFDKIWITRLMEREAAYYWLSVSLGISRSKCHFGIMRSKHLKQAIEMCKAYLSENTGEAKAKKDKQNERQSKHNERQSKQTRLKRAEHQSQRAKRRRNKNKRRSNR